MERNPRRQIWEPTDENIRKLRALYDAEIAENDAGFGELLELLRNKDIYDSAVVVYVSDHGEEFYEHKRWGHSRALSVDQLNVALLIKFPSQTLGSRVREAVQHVDILPTLLDLVGLPIPSTVEGRSLARLAANSATASLDSDSLIFSHNRVGAQYSVLAGDFKLIQRKRRGVVKPTGLYNWRTDPRETDNLLSERPIHAAVLTTLIERKKAYFEGVSGEEAVLDDSVRDELRALGYLQ
jgi:arylsulfatase A-like enzyme